MVAIEQDDLALVGLLKEARLVEPDAVDEMAELASKVSGASEVVIYLIGYRELMLCPLNGAGERTGELEVDSTVAGRAFITGQTQVIATGGGDHVWLPLSDGSDRLGVLGCRVPKADAPLLGRLEAMTTLLAQLVVSKRRYTDRYSEVARREEMSLAAEMHWQILPPLSFITRRVAVAGIMEPVYEIGGDAFDYSLNGDILSMSITDAMGHGMSATWPSAIAAASIRHSRRRGLDLQETYLAADSALHRQFDGDSFVTALIARLDLSTGHLSWVNAGHPLPMLIRDAKLASRLACAASMPLGLSGKVAEIGEVTIQAWDRVVLFSDGVTEGHQPGREVFGEDRLVEAVVKDTLAGYGPAETVRRVARTVLAHHSHKLRDDFTILCAEYRGPHRRGGSSGGVSSEPG